MLKYGKVEKSYKPKKENKLRPHKKVPEFIKDKPQLDISLIFVWDSFQRLSTERKRDCGEIPWSSIKEYCLFYNFSFQEFQDFEVLIAAMDRVFLNHQQNQIKNKTEG